jgi:hypothetical protein
MQSCEEDVVEMGRRILEISCFLSHILVLKVGHQALGRSYPDNAGLSRRTDAAAILAADGFERQLVRHLVIF